MKKMTKYEKIMAGGPRYLAKVIASIKMGYRKKIAKLENFDRTWDVWQEEEDLLTESIFRELMLDEENAKLQQKIEELENQLSLQQAQLAKINGRNHNYDNNNNVSITPDPLEGVPSFDHVPAEHLKWFL